MPRKGCWCKTLNHRPGSPRAARRGALARPVAACSIEHRQELRSAVKTTQDKSQEFANKVSQGLKQMTIDTGSMASNIEGKMGEAANTIQILSDRVEAEVMALKQTESNVQKRFNPQTMNPKPNQKSKNKHS